MRRVGIQGIRGAFHEEAAWIYFGEDIEIVEHFTFAELVYAVSSSQSDFGIMAIENSIYIDLSFDSREDYEGMIPLLIKKVKGHIVLGLYLKGEF